MPQLAATTTAGGVTSSAGPWPVARAGVAGKHDLIGNQVVSGRPTPDATIDQRDHHRPDAGGRRPARSSSTRTRPRCSAPGSVGRCRSTSSRRSRARDAEKAAPGGAGARAARHRDQSAAPPKPAVTLTVVGIAASVSTPDVAAWMSPTDLAALTPDAKPAQEMLYRVDPSSTAADLAAAVGRITASLPADAVVTLDDLSRDQGGRRTRSPSCTSRSCSRSRSSRSSPPRSPSPTSSAGSS